MNHTLVASSSSSSGFWLGGLSYSNVLASTQKLPEQCYVWTSFDTLQVPEPSSSQDFVAEVSGAKNTEKFNSSSVGKNPPPKEVASSFMRTQVPAVGACFR